MALFQRGDKYFYIYKAEQGDKGKGGGGGGFSLNNYFKWNVLVCRSQGANGIAAVQ